MATVDFFLEPASTYTYPAAMRISALADAAGVTVRWRPFLLGPIFKAQGWSTSPFNLYPAKGRYMWRDLERVCAELGLPFVRPDPFPQPSLLAARVAHVGLAEGWGEDFCRGIFRAEFAEGRGLGDDVVADVVRTVGGSPEQALQKAGSDEIRAALRSTTDEAGRLGVFGAPSFVVGEELFWGNDRLEAALAWARRPG